MLWMSQLHKLLLAVVVSIIIIAEYLNSEIVLGLEFW